MIGSSDDPFVGILPSLVLPVLVSVVDLQRVTEGLILFLIKRSVSIY